MLTVGFGFRLNARFLTAWSCVNVTTLLEEACTVFKHLVRVLVTIQGLLFFISVAQAQSSVEQFREEQHERFKGRKE